MPNDNQKPKIDINTEWEKAKKMRAELPVEHDPKLEDEPFLEAEQRARYRISSAASDFLKQHGFKSDGSRKRKIPGL